MAGIEESRFNPHQAEWINSQNLQKSAPKQAKKRKN